MISTVHYIKGQIQGSISVDHKTNKKMFFMNSPEQITIEYFVLNRTNKNIYTVYEKEF